MKKIKINMRKKIIVDLGVFITLTLGILFAVVWKNETLGISLLLLSLLISLFRKTLYDLL